MKAMQQKTVDIRTATAADAEVLAKVGKETFRDAFINNPNMPLEDLQTYLDEAFDVKNVAAELADPRSIFFLAEVNGETAGYAKVILDTPEQGVVSERPMKLKRLYVHQSALGRGVGPALMQRCVEAAQENQQDAIWLTVWEHNPRAQAFYLKWEFVEVGDIPFSMGGSVFNDLLMVRKVN